MAQIQLESILQLVLPYAASRPGTNAVSLLLLGSLDLHLEGTFPDHYGTVGADSDYVFPVRTDLAGGYDRGVSHSYVGSFPREVVPELDEGVVTTRHEVHAVGTDVDAVQGTGTRALQFADHGSIQGFPVRYLAIRAAGQNLHPVRTEARAHVHRVTHKHLLSRCTSVKTNF